MEKSRQKFSLTREEINTILGISVDPEDVLDVSSDKEWQGVDDDACDVGETINAFVGIAMSHFLWALRCLTLPETFERLRASIDTHIQFPVPQEFV